MPPAFSKLHVQKLARYFFACLRSSHAFATLGTREFRTHTLAVKVRKYTPCQNLASPTWWSVQSHAVTWYLHSSLYSFIAVGQNQTITLPNLHELIQSMDLFVSLCKLSKLVSILVHHNNNDSHDSNSNDSNDNDITISYFHDVL
jgi:hypothetical protein